MAVLKLLEKKARNKKIEKLTDTFTSWQNTRRHIVINIKNRNMRQSKHNFTSGITAGDTEPYLTGTKADEDESLARPSILLNSDNKSRNINNLKLNQESQD